MADLRSRIAVKIVDPTTNTNEVGVDASGNIQAILAANSGVDIGDVDVASVVPGTGAANLGKAVDAVAGAADTGVAPVVVRDDALTTLTPADGDYVPLRANSTGALWTHDDSIGAAIAGNELQVDVVGALPAGTNNIGDVDIASAPTGVSSISVQGTAADGAAAVGNPVQVGGVDGVGNVQRVLTDTNGRLQVDVLTGGGSDTPTTPVRTHSNSTNTAAGASADLDTADLGGTTRKLAQVEVSASVPWKCAIASVDNGTPTTLTVLFGRANEAIVWKPPHRNYYEVVFTANAGFDGFRAIMTNMDNTQAADLYATLYVEA